MATNDPTTPAARTRRGPSNTTREEIADEVGSPVEPAAAGGVNPRADVAPPPDTTAPVRTGTDATHGMAGVSDTVPDTDHEAREAALAENLPDTMVVGAGEAPAEDAPDYAKASGVVNSGTNPGLAGLLRVGAEAMQPGLDPTPRAIEELSVAERLAAGYGYPVGHDFNKERI